MTAMEAMQARYSVRQYLSKPLRADALQVLQAEIAACNAESGLRIQLVTNEPRAFDSMMAHYGKFSGVTNYLALVGKKNATLDETCGYYGQHLVLKAQQLGLNTCWVAMTYQKIPSAFQVGAGEKLAVVIALGYGANQGVPHKSKPVGAVSKVEGDCPAWFTAGVEAALLAPTATNQQKFLLTCRNGKVEARAGWGFYTKLDLGIVRYHFELGAGKENFEWSNG